jgi:hypothetical protein
MTFGVGCRPARDGDFFIFEVLQWSREYFGTALFITVLDKLSGTI